MVVPHPLSEMALLDIREIGDINNNMNPIYHLLTFIRDRIPFVGALGVDWLRYELFYPYD